MLPRSPIPVSTTSVPATPNASTTASRSASKRRSRVPWVASFAPTDTTATSGRSCCAAGTWPTSTSRTLDPPAATLTSRMRRSAASRRTTCRDQRSSGESRPGPVTVESPRSANRTSGAESGPNTPSGSRSRKLGSGRCATYQNCAATVPTAAIAANGTPAAPARPSRMRAATATFSTPRAGSGWILRNELRAKRARLVEPAVQRRGPGVAADQHVLDDPADPALLPRGHRDLPQEVVGLAAVVLLRVRVHLEVLDLDPVVVAQPLVHHHRIVRRRREPLSGPAEGGQPLFVRAAHVEKRREHRADRLGHGAGRDQLLVGESELVSPLDLHVEVVAVAREAHLVGEVLRPVHEVLAAAEIDGVDVGRVRHDRAELARVPLAEEVVLLAEPLEEVN